MDDGRAAGADSRAGAGSGADAGAVARRLAALQGPAYQVAARVFGAGADAEDVVQQSYVRAFEALRSGPPPASERAWFLKIVANTARNHLRDEAGRRRRQTTLNPETHAAPAVGSFDAPGRELLERLRRAMDELDEPYRLPVALCCEQGLSQREAAEVLDLPASTVSKYVNAGIEQLRRTLARAGYTAAPAALVGALAHTAPPVPATLAAALEKLVAGQMLVKGTGVAAVSAAAKGGVAMKIIAGVVAAGVLAGAAAVVPSFLGSKGGTQLGSPPAAAGTNPFNGTQDRAEVFEFAQKPQAKREGDKVVITFASKAACDATVSILGPDGKIVKHIASGVLGKNAPWPFQQDSLSQRLEWDGKDDLGKPAPAGCKVHVGLGFKPKHGGFFVDSTKDALGGESIMGMAVAPDGHLYVIHGGWYLSQCISKIGRDGKIVRVLPMKAEALPKWKGVKVAKRPDGTIVPILENMWDDGKHAVPLYPGWWGGWHYVGERAGLAITRSGDLFSGWVVGGLPRDMLKGIRPDHPCFEKLKAVEPRVEGNQNWTGQVIMRFDAEGIPAEKPGPTLKEYSAPAGENFLGGLADVFLAFSPDEKYIYVNGTGWPQKYGKTEHCIYRLEMDSRGQPVPFAGELFKAGNDDKHFNCPRGLAVDGKGLIYVADRGNNRIVVLNPDGSFARAVPVQSPEGVGVGPAGEIYAIGCEGSVVQDRPFNNFNARKARLVKLSAEGKEVAALDLPKPPRSGDSGATYQPTMAVDAAAKPPIVWVNTSAVIWKVLDRGAELAKESTVATIAEPLPMKGIYSGNVQASPFRDECFVTSNGGSSGGPAVKIKDDGTVVSLPWATGTGEVSLIPAPDGSVYLPTLKKHVDENGKDIAGYKPIPTPWISDCQFKGTRGGYATVDGDLYVIYYLAAGKDQRFQELKDTPPVRTWTKENWFQTCEVWRFAADGTFKAKGLVKGFGLRGHCPRVDRKGNIYMGDGNFEPPEAIPLGLKGVEKNWSKPFWQRGMGSVLKFGPEGGEIIMLAGTSSSGRYMPANFKGLVWKVYGYAPNTNEAIGQWECMCGTGQFGIDAYDRVLAPDTYTFCVHLLDSNGNRICTFGSYGGMADAGPEIRFGRVPYVTASKSCFWLSDVLYGRVIKVDWAYAAEETVPAPPN